MPTRNIQCSRRAFTLIEMLVVMAIMLALMGMVLLFYPKRDVRAAAQGAEQLQTYIASAKSRALRDRAPRGVRLLTDPNGGAGFREFQYIEVPEPFAPNATIVVKQWNLNPAAGLTAYVQYDISGAVKTGDMLEIPGDAMPHRITSDPIPAPANQPVAGATGYWAITLATQPTIARLQQYSDIQNYRFIRQPRPLLGEPTLHLPKNVFVQVDTGTGVWPSSLHVPTSYDQANHDIIFSASGEVINTNFGRIVLVVADDNNVSTPSLLVIYAHTGGVASHPKGPAGGSEYIYSQDGKSSGQ